jgi:UDP-GlcNAc:undecaprenyl-phosphate/decaprenyl-phosphate GlcNAc-1-phosphate transferase
MLNVLLTSTVAFAITYLAIPAIMRVASEKKLYDLPDARKLHNKPIASLGGVGIFIGFFLAILLTSNKGNTDLQFFFAAALVIFFLGLKDDILILSPTKKFLGQMAAAAILIHLGNIRIESMHGFMGLDKLPEAWSYIVSYTTVIVVVNAYNLIDGVDGLAGSLGVLTTGIFGTYFLLADLPLFAMISFGLTGSLIAFLCFNYNPAKIFMGDSGSLLLGLVNSILVIKFITVADASSASLYLPSAVAIGFSVLIVPLLDTLRVFSIRIYKGRSPFSPDRNHIHHLLLDRGFSHRYVTISCVGLNLSFIAMAYFGRSLGPTLLICSMVTVFYSLVAALMLMKKPATTLVIASSFQHVPEPTVQPATKVVALKSEAAVAEQ